MQKRAKGTPIDIQIIGLLAIFGVRHWHPKNIINFLRAEAANDFGWSVISHASVRQLLWPKCGRGTTNRRGNGMRRQ